MNIELTNEELKLAVQDYVENRIGINLNGKTLGIVFSATRYEGHIAKLTITPNAIAAAVTSTVAAAPVIPGYTVDNDTVDPTATDAPALAEPTADPADTAAEAQAEATLGNPVEEAATLVEASIVEAAEATAEAAPAATTDAPKPTKATLFGKPAGTAA